VIVCFIFSFLGFVFTMLLIPSQLAPPAVMIEYAATTIVFFLCSLYSASEMIPIYAAKRIAGELEKQRIAAAAK
jgi:hypothetical protein